MGLFQRNATFVEAIQAFKVTGVQEGDTVYDLPGFGAANVPAAPAPLATMAELEAALRGPL